MVPLTDEHDGSHIRRGRPRIKRRLSENGMFRCYGPKCQIPAEEEPVVILPEEIVVLRLIDLEGMEQEEAAAYLGISRRTLWKDLHESRRKITDALVHGKMIEVSGCSRHGGLECPKDHFSICPRDANICPRLPCETKDNKK